jgi:hypothetical protein
MQHSLDEIDEPRNFVDTAQESGTSIAMTAKTEAWQADGRAATAREIKN